MEKTNTTTGSRSDFDLLGVSENIDSFEVLKKAYWKKAKLVYKSEGGENKEFVELNNAYNRVKEKIKEKNVTNNLGKSVFDGMFKI